VYTWVDGDSPLFKARFHACLQEFSSPYASSLSRQRFRDNGELRYSLRSVETHAPWFRKLHIVTHGETPRWLDTSNHRVSIITHDMIFPDSPNLPTFNSNAIELNLHRIPGLSRKFLYFNDDIFLGRDTSVNDFITVDGSQYVYFHNWPLHSSTNEGPVHDRAYAHTQDLVDRLWGRQHSRLLPAHAPQLYDREILTSLEDTAPEEFQLTSSHRFRSPNDLVLRVLYSFFLLESPDQAGRHRARVLRSSRACDFVSLDGDVSRMRRAFLKIRILRPKFFCINDDVEEATLGREISSHLDSFLSSYFQYPSSFERSAQEDVNSA
jgi:hypothetical protein